MTARAVVFGCEGPRLSAAERAFFREADPWGFILFARNVETPDSVRALTAELREAVGRAAPVMIDQEGGRVQRLRAPHWREFPSALADACGPDPQTALELRYRLIAAELSALGVDMNCAPVLDVPAPGAHDVIGDRALGRTPDEIAANGRAVRRGLEAGGVIPVIKHIPGHGRSTVDSHFDLPRVTADRAALAADFAPFRAHADAPVAMTGHLVFEAIDSAACATFSPACVEVIRREIGFEGLLLTDDISMGALEGDMESRAARALAAGCDVILHCNGDMAEMTALAGAIPALAGAAAGRAARVDALPRAAAPFDAAAGEARYRALGQEAANA